MNAKIPDIISDLVGSNHSLETVLADYGLEPADLSDEDRAEISRLARQCSFCHWWHTPDHMRAPVQQPHKYALCAECFESWANDFI